MLDGRRVGQRFVGDLLQRDDAAATKAAIGSDEEARAGIVDPIAQRLGREAAEDHGVHGADARAGEHRDRELGNERQVDGDAIAAADAERLQDVRELADFAMQVVVGQGAPIAGLAFPHDRRLVAASGAEMAIETVDRRVDRPADEPLRVWRIPVEHLGPRRGPLELAG